MQTRLTVRWHAQSWTGPAVQPHYAAMPADSAPAIELQGVLTALNILRVLSPDLEAIARGLDAKISEAPDLFQGAPVVLDVSALDGDVEAGIKTLHGLRLARLVDLLKTRGLVPVAVSGLPPGRGHEASAAGLGVLDTTGPRRPPRRPRETRETGQPHATQSSAAPAPASQQQPTAIADGTGTLTLTQPLRSGQIIYADGRDAIALAAVNAGAELIADGNIHIYASLRGRAMAGARGNTEARIYCQKLEADLVSIAGVYLSADELPKQVLGKPVQVWLRGGELTFSELVSR